MTACLSPLNRTCDGAFNHCLASAFFDPANSFVSRFVERRKHQQPRASTRGTWPSYSRPCPSYDSRRPRGVRQQLNIRWCMMVSYTCDVRLSRTIRAHSGGAVTPAIKTARAPGIEWSTVCSAHQSSIQALRLPSDIITSPYSILVWPFEVDHAVIGPLWPEQTNIFESSTARSRERTVSGVSLLSPPPPRTPRLSFGNP